MGTLMQGMAFGAGSEVAHQAIRGVMGGSGSHGQSQGQDNAQAPPQNQVQTNPCMEQNNNFVEVNFMNFIEEQGLEYAMSKFQKNAG